VKDQDKSKEQLIAEVAELRQQVAELQMTASELRHTEQIVRESETKYRTLIEQSDDAIFLIYGNRFEIINHKFEEMFGVSKEMANSPDFVFTNIVAPKSRKFVLERPNKEGESPKISPRYEFTAIDKHGQEIEVELSVSYPAYHGGLATQGVLRDITERKKAEAERAVLQAQMFQSAKLASLGELAAGIAHEVNNPIFAIREYAQLMLDKTMPSDPTARMLQTIVRQADRIATIARNLFTFARPDDTSFSLTSLESIWGPVHNLIGQSFLKHNIHLRVDIPANLPLIRANNQQLQQVLLNFLINAKDALNDKYPSFDPNKKITLTANLVDDSSLGLPQLERKGQQFVRLSIRDEGIGIPLEIQEQLFNPFFTTKRAKGGTGLGLSISHKIIEAHQGRVEVHSEPGVFAEFVLILPTYPTPPPPGGKA
jgi:PAS domain S-box-containing protein